MCRCIVRTFVCGADIILNSKASTLNQMSLTTVTKKMSVKICNIAPAIDKGNLKSLQSRIQIYATVVMHKLVEGNSYRDTS